MCPVVAGESDGTDGVVDEVEMKGTERVVHEVAVEDTEPPLKYTSGNTTVPLLAVFCGWDHLGLTWLGPS